MSAFIWTRNGLVAGSVLLAAGCTGKFFSEGRSSQAGFTVSQICNAPGDKRFDCATSPRNGDLPNGQHVTVETARECEALMNMGRSSGQGYLIGGNNMDNRWTGPASGTQGRIALCAVKEAARETCERFANGQGGAILAVLDEKTGQCYVDTNQAGMQHFWMTSEALAVVPKRISRSALPPPPPRKPTPGKKADHARHPRPHVQTATERIEQKVDQIQKEIGQKSCICQGPPAPPAPH